MNSIDKNNITWPLFAGILAMVLTGCPDQPHTVCTETGRVCGPGYVCAPGGRWCVADMSCGNGVRDPDERCDDGNRVAGDGCSTDCQSLEICGNGILDFGEACDDGNRLADDGCSPTCVIEMCGNGVMDPYEMCDDGGNQNGDDCSADCASDEKCGNGYIDWHLGERCDDGNTEDDDSCPADCKAGLCGDGLLQGGELCDDGNNDDGDGCSADCWIAGTCGNGVIEHGEQCDSGGAPSATCDPDCTFAWCGDGVVNPVAGEQCDDTGDSPACDSDCTVRVCGDGYHNPTIEMCDDGNTIDDLCNTDCTRNLLDDLILLSARVPDLGFTRTQLSYQAEVSLQQDSVSFIVDSIHPDAEFQVAGQSVAPGVPSPLVPLALGENTIPVLARNPVTGFEVTYWITMDRAVAIEQSVYVKAEHPDAGDIFGNNMSFSASGDTLTAGAPREDSSATGVGGDQTDNSATDSGAVYVVQRVGGVWHQQAYLKASNTDAGDQFGANVALSGNGNTLAVSAKFEDSSATGVGGDQTDNSATDSGAVYVFQRVGGVWHQQAYLKAANTDADDRFGSHAWLSADGDTLAVGALFEDSNATGVDGGVDGDPDNNSAVNSGAVYVFQRIGGTWTQQAYLKADNPDVNDYFGGFVSLSASGDTLAVGAYGQGASGAVYVFERIGSTWVQQDFLKASNPDAGDNFGYLVSLSASGDILAVSAPGEASNATGVGGDQANNSAPGSGAVYLFERTGERWTQKHYIKSSNSEAFDNFGDRKALSSTGDTLVVSAPAEDSHAIGVDGDQEDNSAPQSGAVYLFQRIGDTWMQRAYLKASNTETNDSFGKYVSLSGNGDTLAVQSRHDASGSPHDPHDNSVPDSGAVYIFE